MASIFGIIALLFVIGAASAQQTRLIGIVTQNPATAPIQVSTPATFSGTQPPPHGYYQRQQFNTQAPFTFAPYTFAPYTFAPITRPRYDPRGRQQGAGASASSQQSGRGVQAGGSASASSGYDSRYPPSRYGQASASSYGGAQQPYDPYAQPRPYDSRNQGPQRQDPRQDPRYGQSYTQPPVDYSRYPPTVKSLVLSETGVYLWWTDPVIQYGGSRRGQQSSSDAKPKYTVKYSKASGRDATEQTEETASRDLHLKALEPGTDYRFSVKITRNGQETGWSAPIVNRTLEQLPRSPPSNVRVEPTDRDATIIITPPDDLKGSVRSYIFLYAPSGGSGNSADRKWQELQIPAGYSGAPDARQLLRSLQPGEEYFYTVQAVNSRGSSPFTEIQSFKTASGPSYPTRPPYNPYRTNRPSYPRDPYSRDGDQGPEAYSGGEAGGSYDEATTLEYDAGQQDESTTQYPGYDENTPDNYDPSQTGDQTPDNYEQTTRLIGIVTQRPAAWSPYWGAATEPSNPNDEQGEVPQPPSDVRVERLEEPTDALVIFTPSQSSGLSEYEILYTYDPTAPDELWQIETALNEESQAILTRLSPNTRLYVKVRAKSPRANSAFSDTVQFDTVGSSEANRQDADHDQEPDAGTQPQDHAEEAPAEEDQDADAAQGRSNRT